MDDREGDIYPKWASLPQTGVHLLTRAMVDRRLIGGGTLFAAAAGYTMAGRRQIELPARQPDRAKRTAVVELRYGSVEICRPRDEHDRTLAATVRLRLIDVREVDPPAGVEPLHWRLVTTHEITPRLRRGRLCGKGLAGGGVVSGSLDHRATVPGYEIPGAAIGGMPPGA